MELVNYEQPNILFLKGCFLSDCSNIEDQFDERLINESRVNEKYDIEEIVYDKIPDRYESFSEWKKNTNIRCWTCDCHFYDTPKFLPLIIHPSMEPSKQHSGMDVHGNFCSWPCAATEIELYFSPKKREMYDMLYFLYSEFNDGKKITFIPPARRKIEMSHYGKGDLTIKKYKEKNLEIMNKYISSIKNCKIKNISL